MTISLEGPERPRAALANPRCAFRCLDLRFLQKRSKNLERRHVAFLPWASTRSAYEIQAAGVLRPSPREAKCVTIGGRFTFPREYCAPGALQRQSEGSALARLLARPLGRPGPAATPAARLSIGPRGRLR